MSAAWGGALLLGGALLWRLWQPPIPESGFLYAIREGSQIWRVQGIFQSSRVGHVEIRGMEGGFPRFYVWGLLSSSDAVEGEPTGICFFDHDGDFSGFLPLPEESLRYLEAVRGEGEAFVVTFRDAGGERERSFSKKSADIAWSSRESQGEQE